MRKQSFVNGLIAVCIIVEHSWATSFCSNSFRFDKLCPDPRFGSKEPVPSVTNSLVHTDTKIDLRTHNYYSRSRNGNGNGYSAGTTSGHSSLIDPSARGCDFHRNGVETAIVTAVHIRQNPWNFRHANQCTHIVKIDYDSYDTNLAVSGGGVKSICNNSIGFRRPGVKDEEKAEEQSGTKQYVEEISKKLDVYFWHNFTLKPHHAEFTDSITNFHLSRDDINCANEKMEDKYVQIVVELARGGSQCEIIVQQYKIDKNRSPFGCGMTNNPIPYPIQFCGSYHCDQNHGILTGLKLLSKRDQERFAPGNVQGPSRKGPRQPLNYDYAEATQAYPEEGTKVTPTCVTDINEATTQVPPQASSDDEEEEKVTVTDWNEVIFICAFPGAGVVFIIVVLYILKSKSAREICRAYTYPRPYSQQSSHRHSQHSMYQGSFNSINKYDKNTMPI